MEILKTENTIYGIIRSYRKFAHHQCGALRIDWGGVYSLVYTANLSRVVQKEVVRLCRRKKGPYRSSSSFGRSGICAVDIDIREPYGRNLIVGYANVFVVPTLQMAFGLCSLILLYFEGIMDDLVGLRYRVKFVIQILCALLIVASGIWLNDFHGLFGLAGLSPWFGVPFSVLLVVFIINAINLIDGIDGLAIEHRVCILLWNNVLL